MAALGPEQIAAWVQTATILIGAGEVVAGKIGSLIHTAHPDMTEEELDAAIDAVASDAAVREAVAKGDAGEPSGPPTP